MHIQNSGWNFLLNIEEDDEACIVYDMIMLYADEALSHKEESKSQGESYYIVVATCYCCSVAAMVDSAVK
jgi:hypothetical protein